MVRVLKIRLNKKYPDAYASTMRSNADQPDLFDDDDDNDNDIIDSMSSTVKTQC
jgi:hypothetical protein